MIIFIALIVTVAYQHNDKFNLFCFKDFNLRKDGHQNIA